MEEDYTVIVPNELVEERETIAKLLHDYEISNVSTYIGAGELSSPLCREDSPRILTPTRVSNAQSFPISIQHSAGFLPQSGLLRIERPAVVM